METQRFRSKCEIILVDLALPFRSVSQEQSHTTTKKNTTPRNNAPCKPFSWAVCAEPSSTPSLIRAQLTTAQHQSRASSVFRAFLHPLTECFRFGGSFEDKQHKDKVNGHRPFQEKVTCCIKKKTVKHPKNLRVLLIDLWKAKTVEYNTWYYKPLSPPRSLRVLLNMQLITLFQETSKYPTQVRSSLISQNVGIAVLKALVTDHYQITTRYHVINHRVSDSPSRRSMSYVTPLHSSRFTDHDTRGATGHTRHQNE